MLEGVGRWSGRPPRLLRLSIQVPSCPLSVRPLASTSSVGPVGELDLELGHVGALLGLGVRAGGEGRGRRRRTGVWRIKLTEIRATYPPQAGR